MRIGRIIAATVGTALVLTGCADREAGFGEEGAVSTVTQATTTAAASITSILAGPLPQESTAGSPSATAPSTSPSVAASSSAPTDPITLPSPNTRDTLTVWLLPDVPDDVVSLVNKRFKKTYPKVTVTVVRQDWATVGSQIAEKAPLQAVTPDVLEIANDETAPYVGEGLLADLESARTELRVGEWTPGLVHSTEVDGTLSAVPAYGYGRVIAYDKAAWKAAGVTDTPTSLAEFEAALERVQSGGVQPDYSAFWFPGRYWLGSLPWIWSEGGELAIEQDNTWTGAVDSGESQAGLTQLQNIARKFSRAPADGDEVSASQVKAFDEGRASSALMAPWEINSLTRQADFFALPGKEPGSVAPQYLSGSNLAVSAASQKQGLAVAWMQRFLDDKVQRQLATSTGWIPALESAVAALKGDPLRAAQAQLARNGRFTPQVPQWAVVEQQQVLPDMLQTILAPPPGESPSASAPPTDSGASPLPTSPSDPASSTGVPTPVDPSQVPSLPTSSEFPVPTELATPTN